MSSQRSASSVTGHDVGGQQPHFPASQSIAQPPHLIGVPNAPLHQQLPTPTPHLSEDHIETIGTPQMVAASTRRSNRNLPAQDALVNRRAQGYPYLHSNRSIYSNSTTGSRPTMIAGFVAAPGSAPPPPPPSAITNANEAANRKEFIEAIKERQEAVIVSGRPFPTRNSAEELMYESIQVVRNRPSNAQKGYGHIQLSPEEKKHILNAQWTFRYSIKGVASEKVLVHLFRGLDSTDQIAAESGRLLSTSPGIMPVEGSPHGVPVRIKHYHWMHASENGTIRHWQSDVLIDLIWEMLFAPGKLGRKQIYQPLFNPIQNTTLAFFGAMIHHATKEYQTGGRSKLHLAAQSLSDTYRSLLSAMNEYESIHPSHPQFRTELYTALMERSAPTVADLELPSAIPTISFVRYNAAVAAEFTRLQAQPAALGGPGIGSM